MSIRGYLPKRNSNIRKNLKLRNMHEWKIKKLKFISSCNDETLSDSTNPDFEFEYVDISSVSETKGITKRETTTYKKSPSRAKRIVKEGDVIISTVRTYLKAIAPISKLSSNIIVSTGFAVIRPGKEFLNNFASYALKSSRFINEITARSVGVNYPAINTPDLMDIKIPIPPLLEQSKLVKFLNHETTKIDRLIEKQQQLIELLKEKRQAVISHAVTKGLNPNAPLKPSGVEWLGNIPKHWEIKRIKMLFSESNERAKNLDEQIRPILSISIHHGISDKELSDEELDRKQERSEDRSLYKTIKKNDLSYNMMRAWQGGFGASSIDGLVSPAYVVCKPKSTIDTYYYELLLRTSRSVVELKRHSRGITDFRLRLYWDEFKNIQVPKPPESEINQIINKIKCEKEKYQSIIDAAEVQISLLQERRTALISAAVTGKIDVRDWRPPASTTEDDP